MIKHASGRFFIPAGLLALTSAIAGIAQDRPVASSAPAPPVATSPSDLGFLEVGKAYLIRFPEGTNPTRVHESEILAQPQGPPATFNMNYQVDTFVVRRLGGGSWALLEHPTDASAAMDVASAQAFLANKEQVAEAEADPERKAFVATTRQDALKEIKMTQTWFNLAHATAISDPPAVVPKFEIKIQSITPK